MRLKNEIRGTSSQTLPGFPVALHERGNNASADVLYRFRDAEGRERTVSERTVSERTVSERREPPAGPCIISYAGLLATSKDGNWELGYLATVALCRTLVKERFTGRLRLDAIGLDPAGRVVWVKHPDDTRDNAVGESYIAELNPGGVVTDVGAMFYQFVTGIQPGETVTPPSELNVRAPIWVDAISNAALGETPCSSLAEFLDLLHQHLADDQRDLMDARLAEWALRTRRLSQPSEDAVAVQLGAALSQLGVAANERTRRRRSLVPIAVVGLVMLACVLALVLRGVGAI